MHTYTRISYKSFITYVLIICPQVLGFIHTDPGSFDYDIGMLVVVSIGFRVAAYMILVMRSMVERAY